jgi:hypothetical protein
MSSQLGISFRWSRSHTGIRSRIGGIGSARCVNKSRQHRARVGVVSFLIFVVVGNAALSSWLEFGPRRWRDPEYGKRMSRLQARIAEQPEQPLVVVIGSSRTAMGIRPGSWEAMRPDVVTPRLFNLSIVGSGPIMQLVTVRRMLAEGIRPAVVLLEYWPAFLREDGVYAEENRFPRERFYWHDRLTLREYFSDSSNLSQTMLKQRLFPWYFHRKSLMNQVAGSWLPVHQRTDSTFEKIDDWGWLPGHPHASPEQCERGHEAAAEYYLPLFQGYTISPLADRALRQSVAELRQAGSRVGFLFMPESRRFQNFYPHTVSAIAQDHLQRIQGELAVPLIDARNWLGDDQLPDGFHLTQPGAAELTQRLRGALLEHFPELGRQR